MDPPLLLIFTGASLSTAASCPTACRGSARRHVLRTKVSGSSASLASGNDGKSPAAVTSDQRKRIFSRMIFLLQFLGCSILKEFKYPEFCSPCHDLCVATWQPFLNHQTTLTTWQWEFGFSLEANKLSTNLLAKKNESGSCLQVKPTPSAYQ